MYCIYTKWLCCHMKWQWHMKNEESFQPFCTQALIPRNVGGGHFLLMDVFLSEVGFHLYNCKFHQQSNYVKCLNIFVRLHNKWQNWEEGWIMDEILHDVRKLLRGKCSWGSQGNHGLNFSSPWKF
jgi:hypothetical protein